MWFSRVARLWQYSHDTEAADLAFETHDASGLCSCVQREKQAGKWNHNEFVCGGVEGRILRRLSLSSASVPVEANLRVVGVQSSMDSWFIELTVV